MDSKTYDDAAFAAHMAAIDSLISSLGDDPSDAVVACVMAKAFGDAVAIAGAGAARDGDALVAGINTLAQDAYLETLNMIQTPTQSPLCGWAE